MHVLSIFIIITVVFAGVVAGPRRYYTHHFTFINRFKISRAESTSEKAKQCFKGIFNWKTSSAKLTVNNPPAVAYLYLCIYITTHRITGHFQCLQTHYIQSPVVILLSSYFSSSECPLLLSIPELCYCHCHYLLPLIIHILLDTAHQHNKLQSLCITWL